MKIIIVYTLRRSGTHLTINTIYCNLKSKFSVYNLDKLCDKDTKMIADCQNNNSNIILKTHSKSQVDNFYKKYHKEHQIYIIKVYKTFDQNCMSLIKYKLLLSNSNKIKKVHNYYRVIDNFSIKYKLYHSINNMKYQHITINNDDFFDYDKYINILKKISYTTGLYIKKDILYIDNKHYNNNHNTSDNQYNNNDVIQASNLTNL